MSYSISEIQGFLRHAGWPENLIAKYAAIVMYESGGNVSAHNTDGENSYGLLQIYLKYHPTFDTSRYRDPVYNLSFAYDIYKREGDHAWITSVGKYNRDYQGIATKSRNIYNGTSGDTGTGGGAEQSGGRDPGVPATSNLVLYALGFVFLYLILGD